MSAKIIDGNALSAQLRDEVAQRAAALTAKGHQPGLAVILVGDSQASQVYVRNKVKACEENGIYSVLEKYDASMSEAELLARVDALNHDPKINGILVQ
ncbi:MAG: bifunctional methylenetetrahydrofolate dehydrogenase/methenyltetrahydrofolate cyclohydrolase, partial [Sphingomonadales bacterium]|nr:bifunctional methylenetetrahydrofolate dehydrogenase/methenyltetrahydrofolate cyclohydrolase [Sphingomonadales bacterium]